MPVIHIQVGFRRGLPEVNPRNTLFGSIRNSPERRKMFEGDAGRIETVTKLKRHWLEENRCFR